MKYAVISSLTFTTPAQADTLHNGVLAKIAGKPTWGQTNIAKGVDHGGRRNNKKEIRFEKQADMQELFDFVKDRMVLLPVLKGRISKHKCLHDEPGKDKGCVIDEEFSQ